MRVLPLSLEMARAYGDLHHPEDTTQARDLTQRISEALRDPKRQGQHIFVLQAPQGHLEASVSVRPLQPGQWLISTPEARDLESHAKLICPYLFNFLRTKDVSRAYTRTLVPTPTPAWNAQLEAQNCVKEGQRIEYKTALTEVITDERESPIQWRPLPEVGLDEAARIFGMAATGAPDWDEDDDDPRELIQSYLKEPGLTQDPSCVQIGYNAQKQPVGFVISQVEKTSGWSRITYMGVVKTHRGQGLGTWVHRRGLAKLVQLGGRTYHGGTDLTNLRMQRLFEKHNCQELRRLQDWCWKPST